MPGQVFADPRLAGTGERWSDTPALCDVYYLIVKEHGRATNKSGPAAPGGKDASTAFCIMLHIGTFSQLQSSIYFQ